MASKTPKQRRGVAGVLHFRDELEMSLPRILFDVNAGSDEGGYLLWFEQSLAELERNRGRVAEGAQVIIYMPLEIEMTATLRFDEDMGCWRAIPIAGTISFLNSRS